MLTEEQLAEIREQNAAYEANPETRKRREQLCEFDDRVQRLIKARGFEGALWALAPFIPSAEREAFIKAFDKHYGK